jgi:hypothetical protein
MKNFLPKLVIQGDRGASLRDEYNFSALHVIGHVFAHVTDHKLGGEILKKAGSSVTGVGVTDSVAGKINKENFDAWATEDKASWPTWLTKAKADHGGYLNGFLNTFYNRAAEFRAKLTSASLPAPAPATTARPSTAGGTSSAAKSRAMAQVSLGRRGRVLSPEEMSTLVEVIQSQSGMPLSEEELLELFP